MERCFFERLDDEPLDGFEGWIAAVSPGRPASFRAKTNARAKVTRWRRQDIAVVEMEARRTEDHPRTQSVELEEVTRLCEGPMSLCKSITPGCSKSGK